jgi:hypothetical protein
MLDAIAWRFYLFITKDTKPFDWFSFWVFVGFQVITLSFIAVPLWLDHHRKSKAEEWETSILGFIADGQELLANLPIGSAEIDTWNDAVDALIQRVTAFLRQNSPKALTPFRSNIDFPTTINPVIWPASQGRYSMLNHRLRNLESIMENSEVYFRCR